MTILSAGSNHSAMTMQSLYNFLPISDCCSPISPMLNVSADTHSLCPALLHVLIYMRFSFSLLLRDGVTLTLIFPWVIMGVLLVMAWQELRGRGSLSARKILFAAGLCAGTVPKCIWTEDVDEQ